MAKSQIIKDLANGTVSLEIVLKRTLVIAHDLKNEKLIKWINNELYGYEDVKSIPEYRKLLGNIKLSYASFRVAVTNQSVPSSILPKGYEDATFYKCWDSIRTIEEIIKSGNSPTLSLSEYIPFLNINRNLYQVTNIFIEIPNSAFARIIDNVSRELMSILLEIDEKVGNMDGLDIFISDKERTTVNKILNVHIDSLINVGDEAKIVDSKIAGHEIKNEK